MPKFTDLTGEVCGKLQVIGLNERRLRRDGLGHYYLWSVKCECGTERVVKTSDFHKGFFKVCICNPRKYREGYKIPVGSVFNRLTVLGYSQKDGYQEYYLCRCICGTVKEIRKDSLSLGDSQSCGCLQKERAADARNIHGNCKDKKLTKLYKIWSGMKSRCHSPASLLNRPSYAGKGIIVCDEWRYNFREFESWAIANGYQDGLSIERKDNIGNYEPSNCKWITLVAQQRNTGNNRYITAWGETKILIEWTEDPRCKTNSPESITERLKAGWSPEAAISTPPHGRPFKT